MDMQKGLSAREMEVLIMIANGRNSREIADQLCISKKTVDKHRASIRRRLGIFTIAGLTRYAIREGLIPLEDDAVEDEER